MAKVFEKAEVVNTVGEVRQFEHRTNIHYSFAFDVKDGRIVFDNPIEEVNFQYCLSHPEEYRDLGIIKK